MTTHIRTSTISGLEAAPVDVEVQVRGGKERFTIIGLGDVAVRESIDRVLSAIRASGFKPPNNILINLAPAELKKEGSSFDLPMALGILVAGGLVRSREIEEMSFHGELSLDGSVKPVRGIVAQAILALQSGIKTVVVPAANVPEASLLSELTVVGVNSLAELVRYLNSGELPQYEGAPARNVQASVRYISEVRGQEAAKRAMIIAAAGGHNLLMIGPPGCGKSMLAERFSTLLPPLSREEMLEVVRIHSIAGLPVSGLLGGARPYRAPHHLISDAGLAGGGSNPRPGEISLAHRGVLFLDEFPEYRRSAIEALRAPLESGVVNVSRVKGNYSFPSRFQLIAAMNPCPCGRLGAHKVGEGGQNSCLCSRHAIQGYLRKLSQPILDRIDLHVELEAVPIAEITRTDQQGGDDEKLHALIHLARTRQKDRAPYLNSALPAEHIGKFFRIKPEALRLLERAAEKKGLSARGFIRVLRVSRTIADLEDNDCVMEAHIAEAVGLRSLDRIERYCAAA